MAFKAGDEIHVKLLSDALFDWHALASETRWGDRAARRLWNDHIGAIEPDLRIAEPERDPGALEERTAQQRRKSDQALRARLEPVAERLTGEDHSAIYSMWRKRWDEDDGHAAADIEHTVTTDATGRNCSSSTPGTAATGWHADLRWLTDWIMGWHLPGASSKMWTRNVGGLSVTRIATMRSLYQLHKAFAMRPTPGKPRGAPEKGESNAGVAQRILDAMERMRGQRVKQLASRIAASALGLGGYWKKVQVPRRDAAAKFIRQPDGSFETKEHLVWVEKASPKYVPCHAIVIEDLTNYRPDELQTRRENRQLMNWSSSKVKKYLAEACQLHGLHLRQVSAAWTSRQDSRTGMPGVRCEDVPEEVFRTAPRWRKQVRQANKKSLPQRTERDKYLLALEEKWRSASHKKRHGAAVRIPSRGGDIFVSAADGQTASSGIQADLNAAANIGLKALLDPDWPGRWWYVPCSTSDGRPAKDRVGGCPIIQMDKTLRRACDVASTPPAPGGAAKGSSTGGKKGTSKRSGRQGEIVNLWRDPSMEDILPGSKWHPTKDYWKVVERRVIARLRELAGLGKTLDTATPW